MTRAEKIISIAKSFVGQKEKTGNSGFIDAAFQKLMVAAGWLLGQAWCCYFAKVVWKQAYADSPELLAIVNRLVTGGTINTYDNFKNHPLFKRSAVPVPGAIVIWKHGKGPNGHAGIVIAVNGSDFTTIEGNTNAAGGREGDCVAQKSRRLTPTFKANDLNVYGFIIPA